jgi:hypothetical protein
VPASEPELPEQPPPANFQRVFLRLVAYWMSAEEEAMLAKAASGSVLGEETKEIGQCSFPGCVYIEKHAGEHGFDEAITLLPTPKRQKCAPTKFEIDHSVPQLAHSTKHRADASSSSSVSRSKSSAGAHGGAGAHGSAGAHGGAQVMAPPPARAPSSKQAPARAPAVGAASSAASASAAKRKSLSVAVYDGGGDGASSAHGGASSAHGGANSAHGGASSAHAAGSYSGSSMDADDGLPAEADSPLGSPESLEDKREVYAQAYRLAIEEGCSTLEALQRAQQAISSPLSKHAPNNPKGGVKPKAAVPKAPAPAAARSMEDVAGSSSSASASASAPVSAPKPVAAVFRGGMAVSAVTKAVAPTMSSPKASAPKAPASKAPTAKATSALCAPCASPGGAHHGAPAPHYRRVHVRLNAWWETPDALRTWRLWAMEGLCGFPGCPLTDRHGGPHEFDPELIDLAR